MKHFLFLFEIIRQEPVQFHEEQDEVVSHDQVLNLDVFDTYLLLPKRKKNE